MPVVRRIVPPMSGVDAELDAREIGLCEGCRREEDEDDKQREKETPAFSLPLRFTPNSSFSILNSSFIFHTSSYPSTYTSPPGVQTRILLSTGEQTGINSTAGVFVRRTVALPSGETQYRSDDVI